MIDIDLVKIKAAAKKATEGEWVAFSHAASGTFAVHTPQDKRCEDIIKWPGFDGQKKAKENSEFIAAANPAVVLALIEQLEAAQRERDEWREESRKSVFLYCAMETRAEAAEAQVKELTADLDKESEIRHRIHEELNAIKGVQQPVYQIIDDGN